MLDQPFVPVRAEQSDHDAIIMLEQYIWGSAEEATLEYLHWCLQDPAGQSIVYIIKNDSGRVLSLHMLLNVPACLEGKRIKAGISINVATHPDYRRKGLSTQVADSILGEAKRQGIAFLFSVPNSMSHRLFTDKNNFVNLGKPLLLVRWIDPAILIAKHGLPNVAKSLSFVTKLISGTLNIKKNSSIRVRYLENLDGLKFSKLSAPTDFHFALDRHWLRWRYAEHPFRKYKFALVGDVGSPEALVVYEVVAQYKRALIMEFLAVKEVSARVAQALMDDVVEKCKAAGCSSVCCLGSPLSRKTTMLRKIGFWAFPFNSVWRPKIVLRSQKPMPAEFSLSSMDISYGPLINFG
ncbi:MAG: GNAT family N-acetyltransferase [Desulfomonilaceae bacterium]